MKTAIQQLVDIMNEDQVSFTEWFQDNYQMYIEKEKEQIIDAHIEGQRVFDNYQHTQWTNDQAEEYYNKTYNQKIPELLYKDGTPMRKVKLGKEAQELLDEIDNEKKGDLVRLLRWVLKHYSTGTDIDGFFMWENPMGKEFDSIQVVDHYLNQNK